MSASPPSEAALTAAAGKMKKAETKERSNTGVDPAVVAVYKKCFTDNGGDKGKCCKALELDEKEWGDIKDADGFCVKYLGGK